MNNKENTTPLELPSMGDNLIALGVALNDSSSTMMEISMLADKAGLDLQFRISPKVQL